MWDAVTVRPDEKLRKNDAAIVIILQLGDESDLNYNNGSRDGKERH